MFRSTAVTFEELMVQATVNIVHHLSTYSVGNTGQLQNKYFASYREGCRSFSKKT